MLCIYKNDKFYNKNNISDEDNKKYGYNKELLDYNGHKKKIDDYTITLMYTAYDKMSQIGFIEFEVKKQDVKVKMDIGDNGDAHSLIANRVGFDIMSTGERMEKYVSHIML